MNDPDPKRSFTNDLALVRTDLANERTLLAYLRTSLMVFATGVTLLKFFADTDSIRISGWSLIAVGGLVCAVGILRFLLMRRRLHR
jgi:putative membrane protein